MRLAHLPADVPSEKVFEIVRRKPITATPPELEKIRTGFEYENAMRKEMR